MDPRARIDPRYVEARRILLDALEALAPHGNAVIVAGAQAVYLRTGLSDVGIAPYTTDGDLALDPSLLGAVPELEDAMRGAGFTLFEPSPGRPEPGTWIRTAEVAGLEFVVPVDLIVPEGAAGGGGRRGARLGPHGRRAARRAVGLEAALVDNSPEVIAALDPADGRSYPVEVAGSAALFVAKAHKIHDRLASARARRIEDKDAADVYRLMQTTSPREVGAALIALTRHDVAGPPTEAALQYLRDLYSRRNGDGVEMAVRALRLAIPDPQIRTLCTTYTAQMLGPSAAPTTG